VPVTSSNWSRRLTKKRSCGNPIRAEASAPFDLEQGRWSARGCSGLRPEGIADAYTTTSSSTDSRKRHSTPICGRSMKRTSRAKRPPCAFAHPVRRLRALAGGMAQVRRGRRRTSSSGRTQLKPPLPVLNFPPIVRRKIVPASHGAMETLLLPEDLTRSMKELGQSEAQPSSPVMLTATRPCSVATRSRKRSSSVRGGES